MQLVARFLGSRRETIMQLVANIIISLGAFTLLIVGIYLAILDRGASTMTVVLGTGFLFVVLLLLAKFKRFKGFGFEAEMWEEKQEEAAGLVKELQQELQRLSTARAFLVKGKEDEITKKLMPFGGTEFDCAFARNNGEQVDFWWMLQPALTAAGWKNLPWRYGQSVGFSQGSRPETGEAAATNVEIHLHPAQQGTLKPAATALISALKDVGIDARYYGFNIYNDTLLGSGGLALRAVPVAAGIVGDAQVGALLAAFDMPAQRRRSAALDRRHDLELAEAHMAGMRG